MCTFWKEKCCNRTNCIVKKKRVWQTCRNWTGAAVQTSLWTCFKRHGCTNLSDKPSSHGLVVKSGWAYQRSRVWRCFKPQVHEGLVSSGGQAGGISRHFGRIVPRCGGRVGRRWRQLVVGVRRWWRRCRRWADAMAGRLLRVRGYEEIFRVRHAAAGWDKDLVKMFP